jgi:indole-3-acetate monooxygenase
MGVLEQVQVAAAAIRAEAAACEAARQLTPSAVATLRDAGAFGMVMSRRLGGPEVDPITQLEVIETVARADGSAGWCTMIGSDGGYATSYLDTDVAKAMYPAVDAPTALTVAPGGQATPTGDGYDVSGRWSFSSGCTHAEWLFLGCLVPDDDGGVVLGPLGFPEVRVVGVPAAEVDVVDTWRTTGLAGSGSHDVTVAGVHVPAERTYSIFESEPIDPSPLYRHRWMFFSNIGAVPLGIARAAIEEAVQVAQTKVSMPSFTLVREDMTVQERVARAETLVRAARAFLWEAVGTAWATAQAGDPIDRAWLDVRLATTNAFRSSREAVSTLYEALGTAGVYSSSPLDRHLRDLLTMSQHILVQPRSAVAAGRVLLGLEADALGF